MILIGEVLLVLVNIAMAWWHSELIKDSKPIKHGLWGAGYLLLAGAFAVFNHSWILFIASLFIRKVFFDLMLNSFRGLPLFYVSKSPKSIIDKLHLKLFSSNSELYMTIYFLVIIVINIYLCSPMNK
tara:strand:+ start:950 stop:1330 length:381 start_codon:yes stop_codon:yes gene_type:complete